MFPLLSIAITLGLAPLLSAQTAQHTDIEEWARKEIKSAESFSFPTRVYARWRIEDYCTLTSEEITELRNAVANKPDHPRRRELAAVERQLKEGKIVSGAAAIIQDANNWRFCWDMGPGMYIDTVSTKRNAWTLSNNSLALYPPDASSMPDKQTHPSGSFNTFSAEVWRLFTGGFGCSRPFRYEFERVDARADGFAITLKGVEPTGNALGHVLLKGQWDSARNAGVIQSRSVTAENEGGAAAVVQLSEQYEAPHWDDRIEHFVYAACALKQPNGRISRRVVLEEVRPISADEFEAYVRTPEVGASDVVRGKIEVTNVADLQKRTVDRLSPEGAVLSTTSLADESTSRSVLLSWLGPIIVGIAAVVAVYFVVRRRLSLR